MSPKYLLVLLALLAIIVPVAAWSDNLNNNQSTYYSGIIGTPGSAGVGWTTLAGNLDTTCFYTYGYNLYYSGTGYWITPNGSISTNYYAYTWLTSANGVGTKTAFFDANRNAFWGWSIAAPNTYGSITTPHRIEVIRSGTNALTYYDGSLIETYTSVPGTAMYAFGMTTNDWSGSGAINAYFDDLSYGNAFSDTAIVSAPPHGDYILSDMINPSNYGLYSSTGSLLYSDQFHIQWSVGPYADGWQVASSPPNTRYSINIVAPDGSVVNTTYLNFTAAGSAAGVYTYPMNATYLAGAPLQYGQYWTYLYDGSSVKSTDYFYVIGTGASVSWGKSQYTSGDAATVSYSISSSYYDTTTYSYEIKILNAYGTTEKTQTVSGQTGSISFNLDSSTYSNGVYYAEIIAAPKSGASEIVMNYALTEVSSYVSLYGYVHDENGNLLSGASLNVTQGSNYLVATTNASGYYTSANNWLTGSNIVIYGSYTGHQNQTNTLLPLAAESILWNVTLESNSLPCPDICIHGLVKSSQTNTTVTGATAYIRVNGTSTSPTTALTGVAGYYNFTGLSAGTVYDIWSGKTGYANSTTDQVTAVGA